LLFNVTFCAVPVAKVAGVAVGLHVGAGWVVTVTSCWAVPEAAPVIVPRLHRMMLAALVPVISMFCGVVLLPIGKVSGLVETAGVVDVVSAGPPMPNVQVNGAVAAGALLPAPPRTTGIVMVAPTIAPLVAALKPIVPGAAGSVTASVALLGLPRLLAPDSEMVQVPVEAPALTVTSCKVFCASPQVREVGVTVQVAAGDAPTVTVVEPPPAVAPLRLTGTVLVPVVTSID